VSTIIGLSYDYVFDLAVQLPPEEQRRLIRELPSDFSSKEQDAVPYSPEEFYQFLLRGPVIDEEQIQLMLDAREEVNRCHPISW